MFMFTFTMGKGLIGFGFLVIEYAGGVLDMFAVDHIGIYSRDYICPLCISWIVYKSLLVRFAVFTFQGQSCLLLLFFALFYWDQLFSLLVR
jgi:hypothetical protein